RIDLPARPGRHRVELGSAVGATQLAVNWAIGPDDGWRWRRYVEVNDAPVVLHTRDVGGGDIVSIVTRVVAPVGTSLPPIELVLRPEGAGALVIPVRPGPLEARASGDLDPDLGASAPVEAIVPVGGGHPS